MSLTAAALRDLLRLWTAIIRPDDMSTFQRFAELAATLIGLRQRDSAGLAAAYYEAFRTAEGASGAPTLVMAAPLATTAVQDSVRAAALAGFTGGRRAGQTPEAAARNGFVRASGTATRMVLTGGRDTITGSVQADRQALGWLRITDADPCAFCRMVASRGPAYKSQRTASFQAHDHCGCSAEPFYEGSPIPEASRRFEQEWTAAQRWARDNDAASRGTSNNALNNYRRWLASRP